MMMVSGGILLLGVLFSFLFFPLIIFWPGLWLAGVMGIWGIIAGAAVAGAGPQQSRSPQLVIILMFVSSILAANCIGFVLTLICLAMSSNNSSRQFFRT
jgi:hypothetical protein